MLIQSVHCQGTSDRREDGFIIGNDFFSVFDGVSRPTPELAAPLDFGHHSGGERMARVAEDVCRSLQCRRALDPRVVFRRVNEAIGGAHQGAGIPITETKRLAGVFCAAVSVGDGLVRVLQTGDCYAVIRRKDGRLDVTKNRVRPFSIECKRFQREALERIARERSVPLERLDGESAEAYEARLRLLRADMRRAFYDFYAPLQERYVNVPGGWAVLNGQPAVETLWSYATYPLDDVTHALLFTDGFVGHLVTSVPEADVARIVYDGFMAKGLYGILAETRALERSKASASTITHAEATAIGIVF